MHLPVGVRENVAIQFAQMLTPEHTVQLYISQRIHFLLLEDILYL